MVTTFYDNVGEIEYLDFFFWGGGSSGHFSPKVSTILAVFVIQGYKFFWENKSKFVGQKKIFFDGKPKMTKKIGFENLEIPKMGQHFEKIAL